MRVPGAKLSALFAPGGGGGRGLPRGAGAVGLTREAVGLTWKLEVLALPCRTMSCQAVLVFAVVWAVGLPPPPRPGPAAPPPPGYRKNPAGPTEAKPAGVGEGPTATKAHERPPPVGPRSPPQKGLRKMEPLTQGCVLCCAHVCVVRVRVRVVCALLCV